MSKLPPKGQTSANFNARANAQPVRTNPSKPVKTNASQQPKPTNAPANPGLAPRGMVGTQKGQQALNNRNTSQAKARAAVKATQANRQKAKTALRDQVRGNNKGQQTLLRQDFNRAR